MSPFLLVLQVVSSDGVRAMMESALTARDRVGVQDFVLLENFTSEASFIENLRKRFKENLIYVSKCSGEGSMAGHSQLRLDRIFMNVAVIEPSLINHDYFSCSNVTIMFLFHPFSSDLHWFSSGVC